MSIQFAFDAFLNCFLILCCYFLFDSFSYSFDSPPLDKSRVTLVRRLAPLLHEAMSCRVTCHVTFCCVMSCMRHDILCSVLTRVVDTSRCLLLLTRVVDKEFIPQLLTKPLTFVRSAFGFVRLSYSFLLRRD